jgi:hypothetical protein
MTGVLQNKEHLPHSPAISALYNPVTQIKTGRMEVNAGEAPH